MIETNIIYILASAPCKGTLVLIRKAVFHPRGFAGISVGLIIRDSIITIPSWG